MDRIPASDWDDWRWQTRHRVRSVAALRAQVPALAGLAVADAELEREFPVGVTPYYLSLADPSDPADPILRQVLPIADEAERAEQESADPFHEEQLAPVPGIVHRYRDRALVIPTNFCATLCRHCFRKRTWADGFFMLSEAQLVAAAGYVRAHPEIRDVLITGGDPVHLSMHALALLLRELRACANVEVLRIATRVPVTLPQRVDDELLDVLAAARPLWLITHFNHAREVSPAAAHALRRLIDRGITVQNQTVLLRGVNDSTQAQIDLGRALLALGVRPYYLHLADPVAGAGHFRLPIERGIEIVRGMYGKIAGFGIPRLVVDLPGGKGKVPLTPDFVVERQGDDVWFESPIDGSAVRYRNPKGGEDAG
ncbi:MAG: KamA family radical SAM protein [Planctomycetes bacterium]|nr:KamA family radical SAM protein [Planctomycetota bacterium]